MNKDCIRYLQKVKLSKNVYNPTKMRLRNKLGKSSDDCKASSYETVQLIDNLPKKFRKDAIRPHAKPAGNFLTLVGPTLIPLRLVKFSDS